MEDIQQYIESGILEQYALGELTPAEQAQVEAQAAQHPAIREELDLVISALDFYAEAHALAPPAGMRERVLSQVLAQITAAAPVAIPSSSLQADVNALAQEMKTGSALAAPMAARSAWSGWAIAASVALLLSLLGNALLYSRWQQASSDLVAIQNDQARIAAATQVVDKQLTDVREQNAVLRNDEFHPVVLAGTKSAPTAHAKVLFNPATKAVYVDVKSLPALPEGKQYQLWALDKGKPVDAGTLAAGTAAGDSLQRMKDIASAQTFAMTVEPMGGSVNPTLNTMTVVGNI